MEKLKFESYSDASASASKKTGEISLQFNPANFGQKASPVYRSIRELGSVGETKVFVGMGTETLALNDIVVDGTGVKALPQGQTVEDYIEALRKIIYDYSGTEHEPPFVKVIWGKINFIGKCEAMDVSYKMFKPDGTPLRAMLSIRFTNSDSPSQKQKKTRRSSPDLTHIRTVMAGDTLPLLTYQIYGDSSYYLEVARVNGLPGVNAIKPGDVLHFPPLKK